MAIKLILRRLASAPTFTIVTLLTLAIGIGANSAIFSVINGILLKPLPYKHPEQLVSLGHVAPGITGIGKDIGSAPFLYFTYREQGRSFQDVAMWTGDAVNITGVAQPERVEALDVSDGLLPILGVQPAVGRVFAREDDTSDSPRTLMLSYGYWQSKFGGDAGIVGRTLIVNGNSVQVIGVLPRDFWFFDAKPSIVLPLRFNRNKVFLGNFSYRKLGRLKPGVTMAQAEADAARLVPVAMRSFQPFPGFNRSLFDQSGLAQNMHSLKDEVVGDIGGVLWVLMGTIGMVLLIACANVANLLLVRAEGRTQELAIRAALGADWSQIVRELLLESVTLGVLGGLLGLAVAYGSIRLLLVLAPTNLPRLTQISIDGSVLAFTAFVSLFAGVLFGLIPAIKHAGPQLGTALRAGGRTLSQSRQRHRARNTLVVVQVALAMVLLVSSGLMIRTFYALKQVNPGFTHPETIETMRISIPGFKGKDYRQLLQMQQAILEKIAALPGVESAAMSSTVPMSGSGWHDPIFAEGQDETAKMPALRLFKFVSPGLFKTMGNSLLAGREFTWTDMYERRNVMMVSENTARELWGDAASAIGKRVRPTKDGPWREVIGVVSDERDDGLNKPAAPIAFWPVAMEQFGGDQDFIFSSMSYMVRTNRAGSSAFLEEVQRAVWSINKDLPVANVHTLAWVAGRSMARTSFTLVMLAIAGGMALLLGVIGIYGVISYSVSQRTREIGIRMALGAPLRRLTAMFVTHGLRLAATGVVCGVAGAVALSRLMAGLLFEVRPTDPVTYLAVSLGLALAAAVASYLPALRAASVNPVEALRAE